MRPTGNEGEMSLLFWMIYIIRLDATRAVTLIVGLQLRLGFILRALTKWVDGFLLRRLSYLNSISR